MLYTPTRAAHQGDRIHLFPSAEAARACLGEGRSIVGVAVRFDGRVRRIVPLRIDPDAFDPAWSTPAELHADGSVMAKGPIPEALFVDRAWSAEPAAMPSAPTPSHERRCRP